MDSILISVILPIYNVEKYLKKSIDSVIGQSYKNLEIILVDDGATDSSPIICDEYAKKDNRIKVIHQKNGGLSAARNAGINSASGEFIYLLDADDFIDSNCISDLLNLITKYDADIAECDVVLVNESDSNSFVFPESDINDLVVLEKYDALTRIHDDDFSICLRSVIASNKLYRKNLFDNIKYPLNKLHEDEFTTYKLFYESRRVVFTNKKMYAYVQRENSITHTDFSMRRLDALEAYDGYLEFFVSNNLYEMQSRTCRRYLRLLARLKSQVKESNFEDKQKVYDILDNKFDYICKFNDELYSKHPELEYRRKLCDEFIEKYNEV